MVPALAAGPEARLTTADIYNLKDVRDPQRSPDGEVGGLRRGARRSRTTDKNDSDIWMASWDGTQEIQLDLVARQRVAARAGAPTTSYSRSSRRGRGQGRHSCGYAAAPAARPSR